MRETIRGAWPAGLITAALLTGLVACTGGAKDDGAKPSGATGPASASPVAGKQACTNGTYTWSGVRTAERLTGVSEPERLGKDGGRLTYPLARVYTPHQSVEAEGPAPSSSEVLFSLGRKAGVIDSDAATLAEDDGMTYSFTDVNAKAPELNEDGTDSVDGAGLFVRYAFMTEVEGDFRYSCADGTAVLGHAVGWKTDAGGLLDCDRSVTEAMARTAAELVCAPGSAAAKHTDSTA
ncbi:hypothetical protein ACWD25_22565 [Streptomyces sp. NPDC002920]